MTCFEKVNFIPRSGASVASRFSLQDSGEVSGAAVAFFGEAKKVSSRRATPGMLKLLQRVIMPPHPGLFDSGRLA